MNPAHLHAVQFDPETGELIEPECPECRKKQDQIDGLERDVRAWRARYAQLRRDKDREARENPLWPKALELFGEWQAVCGHPRSKWDADSFFLVEPFLKKHGYELCQRAIAGYAFDPFVTTRKNGSKKRHDDWSLIFGDRKHFEEGCNKAPKGWEPGWRPSA